MQTFIAGFFYTTAICLMDINVQKKTFFFSFLRRNEAIGSLWNSLMNKKITHIELFHQCSRSKYTIKNLLSRLPCNRCQKHKLQSTEYLLHGSFKLKLSSGTTLPIGYNYKWTDGRYMFFNPVGRIFRFVSIMYVI